MSRAWLISVLLVGATGVVFWVVHDRRGLILAQAAVPPDPRTAVSLAANRPAEPSLRRQVREPAPPISREDQLRETARFWAKADLPATATWLLTLSDADAAIATDAALAEIGRDDVPAAIALAQALRRGVDDGRVEHMAQIWTEEDPAAAVTWISSLAPSADRDRLLARAALVRVGHDSAEAARLITAMTAGPARDAAVAATIARLRIYDPAKADSWAALLARN